MKQYLLLVTIFIISFFKLQAQENCEVKLKEISGTYTGECINNKANGKGISSGTDSFEGTFKDGYPEGKGTYTWKDGHYFIGFYKKGIKEGEGNIYYEAASGEDSVISGFWKKDKYIGRYEKQFVVITNSSRINKVDCRLIDIKGDEISITVHQSFNVASVGNITTLAGAFYTRSDQLLTKNNITRVQKVTFPFRAIFYMTNGESTEILFNEKGNYDVYIDL